MHTRDARREWIPNTPTARALDAAVRDGAGDVSAAEKPKPGKYREIPLDPDAPNAPTCSGRKYVVADPDAPDAPLCKPKRYIVVPDTSPTSALTDEAHAGWERPLAEALAERFR